MSYEQTFEGNMGFIIPKMLLTLMLPPAGPLFLAAAGFLIIRKYQRLGRAFIISGFVLLYLLSIQPVSDLLMRPLERSFPPLRATAIRANAIVVLSGGVKDLSWVGLKSEPSEASLERLLAGVKLQKTLSVPLVLSGGSGDPTNPEISEADAMARLAASLGVPHKDIVVERKSRNTIESAKLLKKNFRGKRIILVTSAFHMKRASALFKAQGLDVIPAPAGYTSEQGGFSLFTVIPTAYHMRTSALALHEYLSFLWYKGRGDI
jgi:uncharacterized SAM-binding protein YcdF (DUF218 family)